MTEGKRTKSAAATPSPPGWLVLLDSGLKSVRSIVKAGAKQPDEYKQRVFEALKKIGLFNFMRTVFKWQKVEICSQFVLHWNQDKKKTFVNDIEIDVSVETFVMVTGLLAEESAMPSEDAKQGYKSEIEKIWKRKDGRSTCSLEDFKDPWLRNLLILLSSTVWMRCTHSKRVSADLVECVTEALCGKRLRWSESLHNKFVCEIRRLQFLSQLRKKHHPDGSLRVLRTVGGPVMCFLYIHAKLKAEALAELRGPFPHAKEETMKELVEYYEEESLPGEDVPKSEVTDEDYFKQVQVSSAPITSPDFAIKYSDYRTNKRRLFDQDKGSVSLPWGSSATVDLAAKVLELECVIARQSAELAESRLRLYTKGSTLS